MKKLKYILTIIAIILSFYFTDKLMILVDNKNPLMQTIIKEETNYNIKPVNAEIKDNTIIPGLNGKKVNRHKSLIKMEEFSKFNEIYLKYDEITPDISLKDNKDKIIVKGNKLKNKVALIVEENTLIENYLNDNNIKYSYITKLTSNLTLKREYINGEKEEKNFSNLNSLLNKNKINSKICLINYSNIETCKSKKYYIVNTSLKINNGLIDSLNKLGSGDIILISSSLSLDNLKLLLNEINKQDLQIDYLSKVINENIEN